MKLIPIHDRIVVLPDKPEETTKSGLIIPDIKNAKPMTGKVVTTGDGAIGVPMKIHVGDKVMFAPSTGNQIDLDGEKYLIMRQTDVLGKLV